MSKSIQYIIIIIAHVIVVVDSQIDNNDTHKHETVLPTYE